MNHKIMFFIVCLVSFWSPQHIHKDTNMQIISNKASTSGFYDLPAQRYVTMLHLYDDGTRISFDATCTFGDTHFGCAELGSDGYPYQDNPVWVDVESDYLLDVLPREMNVAENEPTLAALQAQALAARSLADWKFRYVGGNVYMDNSRDYQVFIPYAYEFYAPDGAVRELISNAVLSTNRQYLSYNGESIDAEFGSDMYGSSDDEGSKDYLQGIQDPISTACGAWNNSNRWGMSQLGAYRWSRGNQCATGGDETTAWPMRWDDYRQILVHYYTGIDILDGSGAPIAPEDRWNLLWHDNFGFPAGETPTLHNAQTYPLQLQLQNTSVSDWAQNDITLGYQWTVRGAGPDPANWLALSALPPLEKGASTPNRDNSPFTVSVPAPCGTGDYTLHLDAGRNGSWFSSAGWPDARLDVTVQLSAAQTTPGHGYYADGLGALYYNDQDDGQWQIGGPITWQTFSPPVVFSTIEPFINFDTDISPPTPGVNGTFWSAIWEGNLYLPQAGQYRFYLGGLDDGGRLIIDGTTHIESWLVQGPHEYFSPPLNLTQGLHSFRVEYAQGPGDEAGLSVCWEGPGFTKEVIGASGAIPGQPTPTPFMTPTFVPSATPIRTVTPTLPTPPTQRWREWFAAEEAALQDEPPAVRERYSALLSRVRDEVMLPDPKGDAYIRLSYRHAPEITALLWSDAELRQETRTLMLEARPLLEDLLAGKTDGARLSADWVKRALALLEDIQAKASPQLQSEIRWWRAWLPRFVDKSGQEIWKMLPPREAGKIPQTDGSPEELVLQSLSAEETRAYGRLLSRVRDEVMRPSKGGETYIALVYRYTPEVTALLLNNETLRTEAEALLLEAEPGIQFLLGETKSEWRFSEDWLKRMDALLTALAKNGSPELWSEITWWHERLTGWAGKTPQEVWAGLLHERRVNIGNP